MLGMATASRKAVQDPAAFAEASTVIQLFLGAIPFSGTPSWLKQGLRPEIPGSGR